MNGLIAVGFLLGVAFGWWARNKHGEYKVRKYFQQIQRDYLRKLEMEYDERVEGEHAGTNGWSK